MDSKLPHKNIKSTKNHKSPFVWAVVIVVEVVVVKYTAI